MSETALFRELTKLATESIILLMTRERALWEAVATVAVPSLIIWGVLLSTVGTNARVDEWPLYLIFMALPLPLIFPIYKRYLRGPTARAENPRSLFIASSALAVVGSGYIVSAFFHPRDRYQLLSHLVTGIAWLGIGGEKLRQALRARTSSPNLE